MEETLLQNMQSRFVAIPRQGRLAQELTHADSFHPGYYVVVPGVARKSSRRRARGWREPAPVLLGPFRSDIEARFIQTSAQALGLLVERADMLAVQPAGRMHVLGELASRFLPRHHHVMKAA